MKEMNSEQEAATKYANHLHVSIINW